MKKFLMACAIGVGTLVSQAAMATEYDYCVSSDRRIGHVIVRTGITDFGKEWYRVKAAQAFCTVYGGRGCAASDFVPAKCNRFPPDTLEYVSANGDQIKGLFSGNPALMGQSAVEIVTGVPVQTAVSVAKGTGQALHKACKWIAHHC